MPEFGRKERSPKPFEHCSHVGSNPTPSAKSMLTKIQKEIFRTVLSHQNDVAVFDVYSYVDLMIELRNSKIKNFNKIEYNIGILLELGYLKDMKVFNDFGNHVDIHIVCNRDKFIITCKLKLKKKHSGVV